MSILKTVKAKYGEWKARAPERERERREQESRRASLRWQQQRRAIASEKQRAELLKERALSEKRTSEIRGYQQAHRPSPRGSGFGFGSAFSMQPSKSMQPSGIMTPSYFGAAKKSVKPTIKKKRSRRKTKQKARGYIVRGGKAYPIA